MVAETILPIVSTLLGGGLVLGLFKLRPERQSLLAQASDRAVQSLMASMDELEDRLVQAQKREAKLLKDMAELRSEIQQLRIELHDNKSALLAVTLERDAWKQRAIDHGWKEDK